VRRPDSDERVAENPLRVGGSQIPASGLSEDAMDD